MRHEGLQIPTEKLATFCQRHHVRKLSFFGSILRDDFAPGHDIDVLVEFEAGSPVGLIRVAIIETGLSELLGRRVDLRTPAELSKYFREEVVKRAEVQYEKP